MQSARRSSPKFPKNYTKVFLSGVVWKLLSKHFILISALLRSIALPFLQNFPKNPSELCDVTESSWSSMKPSTYIQLAPSPVNRVQCEWPPSDGSISTMELFKTQNWPLSYGRFLDLRNKFSQIFTKVSQKSLEPSQNFLFGTATDPLLLRNSRNAYLVSILWPIPYFTRDFSEDPFKTFPNFGTRNLSKVS